MTQITEQAVMGAPEGQEEVARPTSGVTEAMQVTEGKEVAAFTSPRPANGMEVEEMAAEEDMADIPRA